jgi:hypothetical protein
VPSYSTTVSFDKVLQKTFLCKTAMYMACDFMFYYKILFMKTMYLSTIAMLISTLLLAQEKTTDVNVNIEKEGGGFWGSPWVWVVGAAIFILLLVAVARGGSKQQ